MIDLKKLPNGDFQIVTNTGSLTLTRAQLIAMLGKVPVTLLPRRI